MIELLVVIAIIAVLAGLLLPTLSNAKQRAQAADCIGHNRQLQFALKLYADDENGWLPPNPDVPSSSAWVQGDMTNPSDATNTLFLVDPNQAKLARYGITPAIYKCVADTSDHVRSFSMNQAVGTKPTALAAVNGPWLDGSGNHIANQPWKTYGKFEDMTAPTPSGLWIFIDEDAGSINDGAFAVSMALPTRWVDWPGTRHGFSASLSFADGHAEIHRWRDGRTRLQSGQVISGRMQPGNEDIVWLQTRTSSRTAPNNL